MMPVIAVLLPLAMMLWLDLLCWCTLRRGFAETREVDRKKKIVRVLLCASFFFALGHCLASEFSWYSMSTTNADFSLLELPVSIS